MKFEKGDKVIVLDLSYFKNYFHYERKCIKEYTVLDADERYFSPYYENYDKYFSGCNLFSIIRQDNGIAMYGGERFYHKEKDKEEIQNLIDLAIKTYDDYCADNDLKRINQLKETIASCQKEIEAIEGGNGNWKSGERIFNNKEYKEKVLTVIKKIFPF